MAIISSLNSRSALLSNFEVYQFLEDLCKNDNKKNRRKQAHLANIVYDVSTCIFFILKFLLEFLTLY